MNQHFPLHNPQYHPFYNTNFSYPLPVPVAPAYNNVNPHHNFLSPTPPPSQRYLFPLPLPTLKELSTPSSPMYIPILTGRSDWCPWSEALMMAVMGMNLFGHIGEDHDSQWGFDPGLMPTYPLNIHQNSSPKGLQAWNIWWIQDGQVLHLLVSWLLPTAHSQLPGAGNAQPQRCTAWSVYWELVHLFGGTDFHLAAVMCNELIALHCAPSHILDYISH